MFFNQFSIDLPFTYRTPLCPNTVAASGFRYTDLNLGWHFKGNRNTQPSVQTRCWPLFPLDCQKRQVQIVCRLLQQNTLHLLFLCFKVTYSLGKVWQSQGMSFGLRLAPHYACIWVNKHSRGNSGILQTNQGLVHQPENHLLASPDGASHNKVLVTQGAKTSVWRGWAEF